MSVLNLVLLFGAGLLLIVCGRRSCYFGRKKLKMEELLSLFGGGGAPMEEALHRLANMYEVPVGILRPDDQFGEKSMLFIHDGWGGIGGERLDEFLYGNGVTNRLPDNWTVGDYVSWYVDRKKAGTLKDVPID